MWTVIDDHEAAPASHVALYGVRIRTRYKTLVALLGEPNGADDDDRKIITTSWLLQHSEAGDVVRLHDWKATDRYRSCLPTIEKFRSLPSYYWHITAEQEETAMLFKLWLENRL